MISQTVRRQHLHEVLTKLAVGLLEQDEAISNGAARPATLLNAHVRHGWEQLCALYFEAAQMPPRTLPELVQMLHQPISAWVLGRDWVEVAGGDGALLQAGSPSAFCEDLGTTWREASDLHLELQDERFKRIYGWCREHDDPESYSIARTFIARHPVIADWMAQTEQASWSGAVGKLVGECYESVPNSVIRNGRVALCPHCGWTLRWRGDEAICHQGGQCARIVGDLGAQARWMPYKPEMLRTLEGIQRYVVAPEIALMRLAERLQTLPGVRVTLYPQLDAYDLLVMLPSVRWAVDFKDYRRAAPLAHMLNETQFSRFPKWDVAFYVFPAYRADAVYLNRFQSHWRPEPGVTAITDQQFLRRVTGELNT